MLGLASKKAKQANMEFHESEVEISKPQPLRIIKRSQTIAGGKAGGRSGAGGRDWNGNGNGRRWSGCSFESKGSPPLAKDGPLTVHKIRRGRGSILDGSLEVDIVDVEKKGLNKMHNRGDFDATPKPNRPVSRSLSVGKFLKTELNRGTSRKDIGEQLSPRQSLQSLNPRCTPPLQQNLDGSPKIPARRPSKSKNFIMKAFGGRKNDESKIPLTRKASTGSQSTLLRRLSHRKSTASTISSSVSSVASSLGTVELSHSFERNSQDIIDVGINSRSSSYYDDIDFSCPVTPTPSNCRDEMFVLCPHISVTPESTSVHAGMCTLWVAIEITGVLRRADGSGGSAEMSRAYSTQNLAPQYNDLRGYGSLHNIAVELQPGLDCIIIDQPDDLFQAKTIRVSETLLMLVKIGLNKIKVPVSHEKETSTDELIDDLKDILGDTTTKYLTIKLNYRHSAFLNLRAPLLKGNNKLLPQHTLLETKATATVKRHNPSSAWSPRNSASLNSPIGINPLTKIIEKHYSAERAREALHKLSDDRVKIPYPRRTYGYSSDKENWKSEINIPANAAVTPPGLLTHSFSMTAIPQFNARGSGNGKRVGSPGDYDHLLDKEARDMDPARKIWSQMRRSSRPGKGGHPRTSISDGHYFSADEEEREVGGGSVRGGQRVSPGLMGVDDRRMAVRDVALRNKRSVGQESLRSMVPSTFSGNGGGRGKGVEGEEGGRGGGGGAMGMMGAVAGVGLVGRNWGQWLPWS
ncbi:ubiquitin-conjugating enzyme protein [Rutstroemia sp. NJR-2017a WRK4]|nr:ubiquitin-conjugating enzyme protein [Rutstroemia sp. NJR-2017a WRK4]